MTFLLSACRILLVLSAALCVLDASEAYGLASFKELPIWHKSPVVRQGFREFITDFIDADLRADRSHQQLKYLAGRDIIKKEAERLNVLTSDAEASEMIETFLKVRSLSVSDFERKLSLLPMGIEDYKKRLRDEVAVLKLIHASVDSRINVPAVDIARYYRERRSDYLISPAKAEVMAVFISFYGVETEPELNTLKEMAWKAASSLRAGEDFGLVVQRYCDEPLFSNRGRLGEFSPGMLVPELDGIVFSMKINDISDPIWLKEGAYILKVTGRSEERFRPFEEAKGAIEEMLFREKREHELAVWIKELGRRYGRSGDEIRWPTTAAGFLPRLPEGGSEAYSLKMGRLEKERRTIEKEKKDYLAAASRKKPGSKKEKKKMKAIIDSKGAKYDAALNKIGREIEALKSRLKQSAEAEKAAQKTGVAVSVAPVKTVEKAPAKPVGTGEKTSLSEVAAASAGGMRRLLEKINARHIPWDTGRDREDSIAENLLYKASQNEKISLDEGVVSGLMKRHGLASSEKDHVVRLLSIAELIDRRLKALFAEKEIEILRAEYTSGNKAEVVNLSAVIQKRAGSGESFEEIGESHPGFMKYFRLGYEDARKLVGDRVFRLIDGSVSHGRTMTVWTDNGYMICRASGGGISYDPFREPTGAHKEIIRKSVLGWVEEMKGMM